MCDAFSRHCEAVDLVAPCDGESETVPTFGELQAQYGVDGTFGVHAIRRSESRYAPYRYAWRAVKRARRLGCDVVYTRNIVVTTVAIWSGLPAVLELHLPPAGKIPPKLLKIISRSNRLRSCVCISAELAKHLTQSVPELEPKTVVAHDGAKELRPRSAEEKPADGRVQVGFVGQLFEGHGIQLIIDLAEAFPGCDFHIVGGDGGALQAWQAKARSTNIVFHGHRPHAEMRDWYKRFDVVLAPYHASIVRHGFDKAKWMSPLKIFEYMSAGKCILCTALPVIEEVLEHRKTALLAPPQDFSAWCDALQEVSKSEALRKQLEANARAEFLKFYTWKQRARRILSAFGAEQGRGKEEP